MLKFLVLFCLLSYTINAAKLPDYLTICTQGGTFKKCILGNIEKNWKSIVEKGDKSLKLASLNPLKFKKLNLQASESLEVDFNDLELSGLETCIVTDVNMDPSAEDFSLVFHFDYIQLIGTYDLNGKILILPIQGNGNSNITLEKVAIISKSKLEIIEKDGKKYYNISPTKTETDPKRVYFKFENLFNGDHRLGDEMNKFLNENWKEVFQEVSLGITTVVDTTIIIIINAFFNNIPINEIHN